MSRVQPNQSSNLPSPSTPEAGDSVPDGVADPPPLKKPGRASFGDDFRRFFQRGLATLLPTLITLSVLLWLWNFLWTSIGQNVIFGIRWVWLRLGDAGLVDRQ